jgi:TPR repeat protein
MLFRGQGVPVDEKRGAEMFRAAAEKGLPSAQIRLARCLAHGAGVQANLTEAAKWHLIAKSGGLADEGLDKILSKLSKAERSKAEKEAADWRDRAQIGMQQQ